MRKPASIVLSLACSLIGMARGEDLNLNEKPETSMVYLKPFALGFGVGGLASINQELMKQSNMFLKLTVPLSFRFQEHWEVGLDLDWWLPSAADFGGALNANYVFGQGAFRPFIGAGAGMQYLKHDAYPRFGDNFGLEGIAQVGMYFDITDEAQLRLRVPFHVVANNDIDRAAGLDVAILFSSPQRTTKIKKLKY